MSEIVCEHPRILMHPRIQELAAKYKSFYILGKHTQLHGRVHPDNICLSRFYPRKHGITVDNYKDCFFVDEDTGETIPMYMAVPCGKCDCCKLRRVNADVFRLQMEAECYDFQPWFVTLTYDNEHVRKPRIVVRPSQRTTDYVYQRDVNGKLIGSSCPVEYLPVGGVNVRDCQLFLKRLRINLKRHGFDFKIRYYLVAEYSPLHKDGTGQRPHYHAIIYGINTRTAEDYFKCEDIINSSWNMGFTFCRRIDMSNPDNKSFYYTTKYMRKAIGCSYPVGCVKPFVLSSRGNGGIGSKFIDTKIAPKLRKTLDTHFQFLSKWTGCVVDLRYTSYVINRVFPSFCRNVSVRSRKALRQMSLIVKQIQYFNPTSYVIKVYRRLQKKYHKYLFVPSFEDFTFTWFDVRQQSFNLRSTAYVLTAKFTALYRQIRSDLQFSVRYLHLAKKAQETRDFFLSRLFSYQSNVDIGFQHLKAVKQLNYKPTITNYVK